MASTRRVLWREGALLTPQHFQQADRHVAAAFGRSRRAASTPFHWGVVDLEVDADALAGGSFSLRRLLCVLPDGTLVAAPDEDLLPESRGLADCFDAQDESATVYLAIPARRSTHDVDLGGERSDGADGSASRPWAAQREEVGDACGLTADRPLQTLARRTALRIRPGGAAGRGDTLDGFDTLEIARIVRQASGGYALDERHVPPLLRIGSSPRIMQTLRRYLEMLTARSEELAGQQRGGGGFAETAGFWLMHAINSAIPDLRHLYNGGEGHHHPEDAYLALARLGAQLCTFAQDTHPRDVPPYDHTDLGATFVALDDTLRSLLDLVIPSRCMQLPLEKVGEAQYVASIRDETLLTSGQMYFSVLADMPEDRLVVEFPAKVKLSSRDKLQELVMMALRGATVRHVATPPSEIPVQPGRVYFQLEKTGEHWEAIQSASGLAIHVPPTLPVQRVELLAVQD